MTASPWSLPQPRRIVPTALFFLVRGRDAHYEASYRRFLTSYRRHPAGLAHDLILICKGFEAREAQARVEADFAACASRVIEVADDGFDLGAYRDAAALVPHERVSFLNTHSEILSSDWLLKLTLNLDRPGTGMVGATASFEQLRMHRSFPKPPNPHLRSNGFLIERVLFLRAIGETPIRSKLDALLIESGPASLTSRVLSENLGVLLVGADARGYPPALWPRSRTFRLGPQDNLLVGDNQTRSVSAWPWHVRRYLAGTTWQPDLGREIPMDFAQPAVHG